MEQENKEIPYIYKWRSKNKKRYLEISRAGSAKYYEKNKESKKAYARAYYHQKKIEKYEADKIE